MCVFALVELVEHLLASALLVVVGIQDLETMSTRPHGFASIYLSPGGVFDERVEDLSGPGDKHNFSKLEIT